MNAALAYVRRIHTPEVQAQIQGMTADQLVPYLVETAFGENSSDTRRAILDLITMLLSTQQNYWQAEVERLENTIEEYADADTLRTLQEAV